MQPFEAFDKTNLFVVADDSYTLVIAGFPIWRAFISAAETDIWIEITPAIDVSKSQIFLPLKKKEILSKDLLNNEPEPEPEGKKRDINPEIISNFFATVPPDILELVSRFPDSHWELIRAAQLIGDDFLVLVKTNPALAYTIVNMEKLNPSFLYYVNIELLKRMIRTKRKEILSLCGFPESAQIVKIFSKINPGHLDVQYLIKLKAVLSQQSEVKERITQLLSFAKQINKNLLHLVCVNHNVLPMLTDKLVYELINDVDYSDKSSRLLQMIKDGKRWNIQGPSINSIANLEIVKQKFDEKVKRKRDKLDTFPAPPCKDNEFVTAIKTESELISWSKKQQNCIRHSANMVRNGKSYFYKIIYEGEEATLELKSTNRELRVRELKGVKNRNVSARLSSIVSDWLKQKKIL